MSERRTVTTNTDGPATVLRVGSPSKATPTNQTDERLRRLEEQAFKIRGDLFVVTAMVGVLIILTLGILLAGVP